MPSVCYWLWRPGSDTPLPEFGNNAVWIGHGWLGDDGWFVTDWTKQLANATFRRNCDLILGIPAYEDAGVGYHYASAENISSALRGISAADRNKSISGIALYCEWEMNEAKWRAWRHFVK